MLGIYQPSEDSYFLSKILKKIIKSNKSYKVLDIGAGTGIQAETLINYGINPNNVTLTDVNTNAINYLSTKFPKSNVLKSNLFSNILEKFDIIIFNPPYLPKDKFDKEKDTTGGKKGSEIINRFLEQAKNHLNKNGKIILLTSSLTKGIKWGSYNKKLLGKKKLFFEQLYVWELKIKQTSHQLF